MKKIICLFVLALLLSGCASNLANIKEDYIFDKSKGNNVIFGKISFKDFPRMKRSFGMSLIRTEDKYNYAIYVDEKTSFWKDLFDIDYIKDPSYYFAAELPQGTYEVSRIYIGSFFEILSPGYYLHIQENNSVLYIGTLQVKQTGKRNWVGEAPVSLAILDENEEVIKVLRERFPDIKEEVKINLMSRK